MKNQRNIDFTSKFHLLNSQENSEEIIWSCSDSSDYETTHKENSLNISNKIINRKRKRANKKLINKSNLDINFTDCQDKIKSSKESYLNKYNTSKSPIICQRNVKTDLTLSPIILLKHASPMSAVKIKKKLFENNLQWSGESKSEVCVNHFTQNKNETKRETKGNLTNIFESSNNLTEYCDAEEKHIINKSSNQNLIKKVKSYFDDHFSSQSTQHSISECETDSSRSIEVEITSSLTPTVLPIKLEPKSSSDSLSSFHRDNDTKSKKVRYKKNGLSFRLNSLLKRQNASFSLWQHEKYLAVNSNFVIPRKEFIAFQILNVNSKCGSFLIEVVDSDGRKYLILINNLYINNNVLEQNAIFKLYKPFTVIDFDIHYKLVVNVFKFECTSLTG